MAEYNNLKPTPEKMERIHLRQPIVIALVVLATAISIALHFSNLAAIGDSNAYYTAGVKSMLQSWPNFFFVAAEPGGSVSIDKPPLGLWIEAGFAYFLGVSGFSTSLPNIIAGVLSVPLIFWLVRKHFGDIGGVAAAWMMAVTPVVYAADRNNTMDGMLTFILLLAAWAFLKAVETNKLRFVLLGSLIVGLGFNIKMMQAFLPLPAFYAFYFFGSQQKWVRKGLYLTLATMILVGVSLAWPLIVDSVPASERPYVGSSTNNTVMELIFDHNGIDRLLGKNINKDGVDEYGPRLVSNPELNNLPDERRQAPNPQREPVGQQPQGKIPPQGMQSPDGPMGNQNPSKSEVGESGFLRFFEAPLAKEMSWLLPFALISLILILVQVRFTFPISKTHQGLVLWGGWLVTCLVFFSIAGFFHAYYLIMLAPALAGIVGGGVDSLVEKYLKTNWARWLLLGSAFLTILFQVNLAGLFKEPVTIIWIISVALLIISFFIFLMKNHFRRNGLMIKVAFLLGIGSMLIIPSYWSFKTVQPENMNHSLPGAYSGRTSLVHQKPIATPDGTQRSGDETQFIEFLQENTQDVKYLVAVPSAQIGAPFVLETGRPVLYMGGFNGSDTVVTPQDLQELVENGELRYVLFGGQQRMNNLEIANWLNFSCKLISGDPQINQAPNMNNGGMNTPEIMLYQCGH